MSLIEIQGCGACQHLDAGHGAPGGGVFFLFVCCFFFVCRAYQVFLFLSGVSRSEWFESPFFLMRLALVEVFGDFRPQILIQDV